MSSDEQMEVTETDGTEFDVDKDVQVFVENLKHIGKPISYVSLYRVDLLIMLYTPKPSSSPSLQCQTIILL